MSLAKLRLPTTRYAQIHFPQLVQHSHTPTLLSAPLPRPWDDPSNPQRQTMLRRIQTHSCPSPLLYIQILSCHTQLRALSITQLSRITLNCFILFKYHTDSVSSLVIISDQPRGRDPVRGCTYNTAHGIESPARRPSQARYRRMASFIEEDIEDYREVAQAAVFAIDYLQRQRREYARLDQAYNYHFRMLHL